MDIRKSIWKITVITLTVFAVFFTACIADSGVHAASYKMNKKKTSVYAGMKTKLTVIGRKNKKRTTRKIKWRSANRAIATVSRNGYVKGKKAGKVRIYARVGRKTYRTTVTVRRPVQRINKRKASAKAGQKISLKMYSVKKVRTKAKSGRNKGKYVYAKPAIKWYSANKSVATVSKGRVTAKKQGKVTVYAKVGKGKKKYKCVVTVKYPNYRITAKSTPIKTEMKGFSGYNSKTRQYYAIRSYLETFETAGGGTLTLSPGTYTITNTLYVPSNVTINFSDNTTVNKGTSTGTSRLTPAKSMFQLCAPSKAKVANTYKKGKYRYGYKGYGGVSNVRFNGYGNSVISNRNMRDSLSFILGHNRDVSINNISFRDMNYGHFIEVNSSNNVRITNCSFQDGIGGYKEAINIDTPDLRTNGFNSPWSSFDRTPVSDLTLSGCSFNNVTSAIGTHRYSPGKPHTNIKVLSNTMTNLSYNAISAMYWQDSLISGNNIDGIYKSDNNGRAIEGGGTVRLTVTGNRFSNLPRVARFFPTSEDNFEPIYADMPDSYRNTLRNSNTFVNMIKSKENPEKYVLNNSVRFYNKMKSNTATDWDSYEEFFLNEDPTVSFPK